MCLTIKNKKGDSEMIFSSVIIFLIFGTLILTLNAQLLRSNITFFQGISIIGYSLFPITVASMINLILFFIPDFLQFFIALAATVMAI